MNSKTLQCYERSANVYMATVAHPYHVINYVIKRAGLRSAKRPKWPIVDQYLISYA